MGLTLPATLCVPFGGGVETPTR